MNLKRKVIQCSVKGCISEIRKKDYGFNEVSKGLCQYHHDLTKPDIKEPLKRIPLNTSFPPISNMSRTPIKTIIEAKAILKPYKERSNLTNTILPNNKEVGIQPNR